jgi:hypothetical protein
VPHSQRTGAIAIKNTVAGFIGFFTTLAVTPLVTYIQANGNKFLFLENVCAQQVLSFFAVVVSVILVLYLNIVIRPMKKEDGQ